MKPTPYADKPTWKTQKGETKLIEEMETSHIFHSLRMLWNHLAPASYQLRPFKRYSLSMSTSYMKRSILAFLGELRKRKDLTQDQEATLYFMKITIGKALPRSEGYQIQGSITGRIESTGPPPNIKEL